MRLIPFLILGYLVSLSPVSAATGVAPTRSINTSKMDAQDQAMANAAGIGGATSLSFIISVIIQAVLGFLGIIFLVLTIMAGFKWMTAGGNEDEIKKAKQTLTNSVIGLIIVLAAYTITYSVFKYLPFGGGSGGVSVG